MVKRLREDKRFVLVVSLLAVLALVMLAAAINNISFRAIQPLGHTEQATSVGQIPVREIIQDFLEIPLWKQIVVFASIILLAVLVISMLTPETRKRLLKMLVRMAFSVLAIYLLVRNNPGLFEGLFRQFTDNGEADSSAADPATTPVFRPPQIPASLSFFITLVIVVITAVILWRLYVWWKAQNEFNEKHPLKEIAKIARASLNELSAKGASPDVIIRCYENMSDAVFTRRGLQRNYAATAAEFARQLENAGLPREPVQRLTRLFESARYSTHTSSQADIDEAVACLTSILAYCGQTA